MVEPMKRLLLLLPLLLAAAEAQPAPAAASGFDTYVVSVESRLARQHNSPIAFLVPADDRTLRRGDLVVERLTPASGASLPGALMHHWRATAFAPGASAADLARLLRDFNAYPHEFSPEVLRASSRVRQPGTLEASLRVRQKHILTVVLDTDYDVSFGGPDARHGFSASRSTRIREIADPGTAAEHALAPGQEHGFLWRQNTYWTWEERDGGLFLQVESVSLSRAIPAGLGWAVRPFVESIPRESLEFTLRSTLKALPNHGNSKG